ncbi:unnamed protein product [Gongylonema pulchrum]|uniref:Uncharacterized protein n=1 Tax=Gongylonema pulchrum TaxID=637853 RepID=A0A3P6R2C5_9BILA|nr:unnamed protein product [Gongylonema pulchrum]
MRETIEAARRESMEPPEAPPPTRKICTVDRFKRLGSQIAKYTWKAPFMRELSYVENLQDSQGELAEDRRSRRATFIDNFVANRLYSSGPIDTFAHATAESTRKNNKMVILF